MELYQRNEEEDDEEDEEYIPNGSDAEEEEEEETDSKQIVKPSTKSKDDLSDLEPETEENIYNLFKDQTKDIKEVINQTNSSSKTTDDVESFWKEMVQSSSSSSTSTAASASSSEKIDDNNDEPPAKKLKLNNSPQESPSSSSPTVSEAKSPSTRPVLKRSNLDSYLNSLQKKSKETIVNSSKRNWEQFKQKEGIESELNHYVKDGYLEKQAFLERSKLKQMELDKQTRLSKK